MGENGQILDTGIVCTLLERSVGWGGGGGVVVSGLEDLKDRSSLICTSMRAKWGMRFGFGRRRSS